MMTQANVGQCFASCPFFWCSISDGPGASDMVGGCSATKLHLPLECLLFILR